jgi:hypothetical protein
MFIKTNIYLTRRQGLSKIKGLSLREQFLDHSGTELEKQKLTREYPHLDATHINDPWWEKRFDQNDNENKHV